MQLVDASVLRQLAMGAAVLSAGGGSFPYLELLSAQEVLQSHAPVPLIPAMQLPDNARVALVAMVGAPLALSERLVDAEHFARPVAALAKHLGTSFDAVMGYEIGSMNSLIPAMVATRLSLPLVDADTLGRSFPEIQMSAFAIADLDMTPIAASDIRGNDVILTAAASGRWVESLLRPLATACGSILAVCGCHSGRQIGLHAHLGSYSRAIRIGAAILDAQARRTDPVAALFSRERGSILARGKVRDVMRTTTDGFVRGQVEIDLGAQKTARVHFQNEYTLVDIAGHFLAMVPDLITILDAERGEPLGTEALRYGQHVVLGRLPALERHLTPQALTAVGPRAFGYDFDYDSANHEAAP
jgi:DUF917 family protein